MPSNRVDRSLAIAVLLVAALNTIASLSMPAVAWRPDTALVVAWLFVLVAHAGLYWSGDWVRARMGLKAYVATQCGIVFFMGVTAGVSPVVVGLYIALISDVIVLAGDRWGVVSVTVGAIAVFAVNATIVSDLYRGATAGLLLAITAVVTAAVLRLMARARPVTGVAQHRTEFEMPELTARELQVLHAIALGARSAQIASDLGIAERTVKAHLASIYQKLRVESRAAAVAIAIERGLTSRSDRGQRPGATE